MKLLTDDGKEIKIDDIKRIVINKEEKILLIVNSSYYNCTNFNLIRELAEEIFKPQKVIIVDSNSCDIALCKDYREI
jgi:hypothetical protein